MVADQVASIAFHTPFKCLKAKNSKVTIFLYSSPNPKSIKTIWKRKPRPPSVLSCKLAFEFAVYKKPNHARLTLETNVSHYKLLECF